MPLTEQQKADLAKKRGQASASISDPAKKKDFIAKQGEAESKGDLDENKAKQMDREADDTIATGGENIATGVRSYKKGTKFVPKTGLAKLHEGEEVITADKNPNNPKNFSKEQIGEDTDRQMRGLPQKHGAALGDDIPEPALQDDGSDGLAPDMDPDAAQDADMQSAIQQVQDEQQSINGKLDKIMAHLGLNEDEQSGDEPDMGDDDRGFGGL